MDQLTPIVVTGPESTGKSLLGKQLALHFKAPYIAEYARLFLEKNGGRYTCQSLSELAKAHLSFQQERLPSGGLVFLDTDLINYKIWFELVCHFVPPFLPPAIEREQQHRYLLTAPDIPWQPDPLRENAHPREKIFNAHQQEIIRLQRPYKKISGQGRLRIERAIRAVECWL